MIHSSVVEGKIRETIAKTLDCPDAISVDIDESLPTTCIVDSLRFVAILVNIEDTYQIEFSADELAGDSLTTIRGFRDAVLAHLKDDNNTRA